MLLIVQIRFFSLLSLIAIVSSVIISYTKKGEKCMTDCVPYSDYYFCYLGWGQGNWDKCTKGTERSMDYFTSLYEGKVRKCTSLCGKFGYSYNWCFTGEGGAWDYCTDKGGISATKQLPCKKECKRNGNGPYECITGSFDTPIIVVAENPGIPSQVINSDYCAPDPFDLMEFNEINSIVLAKRGEYKENGFHQCRVKRYSENVVRNVGVEDIAARYERRHSTVNYRPTQQVSATSYTYMQAPPILNMRDERLTLVVRATIRRNHLQNIREHIPEFVRQRMENMNAVAGDECGHILAASLGGPTHDFNFVPQSAIVNRCAGGTSYWYYIEGDIRRFFNTHPNGYVTWTVVISYGDLNVNRRPTGFGLIYRQYDANNVLLHESDNCYFSNDPTGGCPI